MPSEISIWGEEPKRVQPFHPVVPAKIAIVIDAPSMEDLKWGKPLSDQKGKFLNSMLRDAGINKHECYITSVLKHRPLKGDVLKLCDKKKETTNEAKEIFGWKTYPFAPLASGKYLPATHCVELFELQQELMDLSPNLIIALGNVAVWAVCGISGITKHRGTAIASRIIPGTKVIPTFNPGAVQADYSKKVVVVADLIKAERESHFPELIRPERKIYIAETIEDIRWYWKEFLADSPLIGCDIETLRNRFISCISFSDHPSRALDIPFIAYDGRVHSHYWQTPEEELAAWDWTAMILEDPTTEIVGQNFLYDIQYLLKCAIQPKNVRRDTMIAHHALYPELPKSLGFLGSVYTNEASWKNMRPRGKQKTKQKKDE